jgi:hypothetical protein
MILSSTSDLFIRFFIHLKYTDTCFIRDLFLLFSSIEPSQAQKTIPPANTDRLSGTGDLALDLLVGLFLLGLLLGPSLILFLLLSLLFCFVRKRHKNNLIYMSRQSAVGNVHVSKYLLTKNIPPAVVLGLLRLLALRSHTG